MKYEALDPFPYDPAARQEQENLNDPYFGVMSIEDKGFGNLLNSQADAITMSRALWSGDKTKMANSVFQAFPEVQTIAEDDNGYQYFEHPQFGRIYTEKPGFDLEDLAAGTGKAALYAVAVSNGWLKTILGEGAAEAMIDLIGGQATAESVMKAGARGATWGVAGKGSERIASRGWNWLAGGKTPTEVGQMFMEKFGVFLEGDDLARVGNQLGPNPDLDAITPEAVEVIARGEMPLSTAQMTNQADDWAMHQQLAAEGKIDPLIQEQGRRMQSMVPEPSRDVAAAGMVNDIRSQAASEKGKAQALYKQVREGADAGNRTYLDYEAIGTLGWRERVTDVIPDTVLEDIAQYPALRGAMDDFFSVVDVLDKPGSSLVSRQGGIDTRYVRQKIRNIDNKIGKIDLGKEEGRHLVALRGAVNDWYNEAIEKGMIHGDLEMIDALTEATALYRTWARKFKGKRGQEDLAKMMEHAMKGSREPTEIAKMLMGQSAAFKGLAVRSAKYLRDTMGPESPAYKSMADYALNLLMTNTKGAQLGPGALLSNLATVATEKGVNRELFTVLMGQSGVDALSALHRDIRQTFPQGLERAVMRRSSGTAERKLANEGINALKRKYGTWPGAGFILDTIDGFISGRQVRDVLVAPQLVQPGAITGPGRAAATAVMLEQPGGDQ
jgi:hypothetical protein